MVGKRLWLRTFAALAVCAAAVAPSDATSLRRMGLDKLTAENATVATGRVVDVRSYWNDAGTFILSDVRFVADDIMKGGPANREFTFTIMGGTVGDLTTLIVAGPEVVPGREYVVFLNREDLPGTAAALTVRDLSQGIFDVVQATDGKRAVSQAVRHPLLADESGLTEAPGGARGLQLDRIQAEVRRLAALRTE